MEFPITEELHALVLLIDEMREGLEGLGVWSPAILHASSIIIGVLILVLRVIEMLLVKRVAEREVSGIPRHWVLHRLHIKFESRDREVA